MSNLSESNVCLGMDGEYWIKTVRQKSDIAVSVPILPQAMAVMDKYKDHPEVCNTKRLLPYLCNQKINDYLKEIQGMQHSKKVNLSCCQAYFFYYRNTC